METEKEYFAEDKKSGKGKGGKYLEKEKNIICGGEEKTQKEKEENIWRRKKCSLWRRRRTKKENIMETLHWRGKNYCGRVDGRTGRRLKKKSSRI